MKAICSQKNTVNDPGKPLERVYDRPARKVYIYIFTAQLFAIRSWC